MTSLCFNLMVIVMAGLHLMMPPQTHGMISKRCQSVCARSDGQDFCQRCRMRVPMRFGKRTDSSQDLGGGGGTRNTIQRSALTTNDDDDDESRFEEHKAGSSSAAESSSNSGDSLRAESQLLLDSMRNFVRDLDDWNRDLYDQ